MDQASEVAAFTSRQTNPLNAAGNGTALTPSARTVYNSAMRAVEFTTELGPEPILAIPQDAAAQLPKTGMARIIVLTSEGIDDPGWQLGAYEQYMRDDAPEDAVYDDY